MKYIGIGIFFISAAIATNFDNLVGVVAFICATVATVSISEEK